MGPETHKRIWLMHTATGHFYPIEPSPRCQPEDHAAHIGVKFQQVQKYETGTNRVSASRLWLIAKALNHDIGHFFAEVGGNTGGGVSLDRQSVEFFIVFQRLDQQYRDALFRIAKSMV